MQERPESLNLAQLWQLPVLFVCENNLYAMGTALERSESEIDIHAKAASYGIASVAVDGMDVVAVEAAAFAATESIRNGRGPRFMECRTYRFRAHSMFDPQLYRDKEEIERWKQKGPILRFSNWLKENKLLRDDDFVSLESDVAAEVDAAVAFAEAGAWEPVEDLANDVIAASAQ